VVWRLGVAEARIRKMAISKETKVGAFVLAGLIIAGAVIFMIGQEKRLFDSKVTFRTSFSDVQGLKAGAPVRLGGVDIGTVARVAHGDDASDNRLYVELHVVRREAVRVRQDTIAEVSNKGLLGDKMIELSSGSSTAAALPSDAVITGKDPTDFGNLFAQVGTMTKHADQILSNLEITSKALASSELHDELRGSVHAVNVLLRQAADGGGYVHRLLTDPSEAERLSHLVSTLDHLAGGLDGTVAEAHKAMARVNAGPGLVHEVLYGEKSADAIANFGSAAGELSATLRGIRDGNGLAHGILYGGDEASQQVTQNLGAATADLRDIMAGLRTGKGTLGALLVDPSVYEDLKSVLGNVQRNDSLRALVRYSIKQDEKQKPVK
jgi:phospholipid/cholesterol/gamma-HCH transport system substrate-binding protein